MKETEILSLGSLADFAATNGTDYGKDMFCTLQIYD